DPDVVGQGTRDLLDDLQARRVDAVVIGAENSHACSGPFPSIPQSSGAGLSGYRHRRKPIKTRRIGDISGTRRGPVRAIGQPFRVNIWHRVSFLGRHKDFVVARLLTLMAIFICGALLAPSSPFAESDQGFRSFR